MFIQFNPNPKGKRVGDCTIRAISKALNQSWDDTHAGLSACSYALKDMPSANHIWGEYLKLKGFRRYLVDDKDQLFYTVKDFCRDNPKGTYILAISGHVVCVRDGDHFDTFDSGDETPIFYWKREELEDE